MILSILKYFLNIRHPLIDDYPRRLYEEVYRVVQFAGWFTVGIPASHHA